MAIGVYMRAEVYALKVHSIEPNMQLIVHTENCKKVLVRITFLMLHCHRNPNIHHNCCHTQFRTLWIYAIRRRHIRPVHHNSRRNYCPSNNSQCIHRNGKVAATPNIKASTMHPVSTRQNGSLEFIFF